MTKGVLALHLHFKPQGLIVHGKTHIIVENPIQQNKITRFEDI